MKKNRTKQPKLRLLKAGCVGAGLLSISNPTEVTAADIGMVDLFNSNAFSSIANPFPRSPLGVHVATGNLDGDAFSDIVIGNGAGAPLLAVFRAKTADKHAKVFDLDMLPSADGVTVATGDINGDGLADILVTSAGGASSAGHFLKFDTIKDGELSVISSFNNIFEGFSGGVRVASGDLDGDLSPDFVAGKGYPPGHLTIKQAAKTYDSWIDFDPPLPFGTGGVEVAMGDVDGDGLADVLVVPREASPGTALTPFLLSSKQKKWLAIDSWSEPAGVHVAMGDIDGDSLADIIVGSPVGVSPYIQGYGVELNDSSIGLPKITPKIAKESHGKFFVGYDEQGVRVAVGDVTGDGRFDIVFAPASIPEPTTLASIFLGFCAWLVTGWRRRRDGS
jgi:FG-GAP repeat